MSERLAIRAEEDGVKAVCYGERDAFIEGEIGYAEADKLAYYEDLEEQGRLIELPCAMGDIVYLVSQDSIPPFTINEFTLTKHGVEFKALYCGEERNLEHWAVRLPVSNIGKTVFLTPEEAEAKLKELRGEQE